MPAIYQKRKEKWYVICNGREKGIFTNWDSVKDSIDGYPNAKFKSFIDENSAEQYWKYNHTPIENCPPCPVHNSSSNHCYIQVRSNLDPSKKQSVVYGIHFKDDWHKNLCEVSYSKSITINRMFWMAIDRIFEECSLILGQYDRQKNITIHIESPYITHSIYDHLPEWKKNGFITAKGTKVEHQDIIKRIDRWIQLYPSIQIKCTPYKLCSDMYNKATKICHEVL